MSASCLFFLMPNLSESYRVKWPLDYFMVLWRDLANLVNLILYCTKRTVTNKQAKMKKLQTRTQISINDIMLCIC